VCVYHTTITRLNTCLKTAFSLTWMVKIFLDKWCNALYKADLAEWGAWFVIMLNEWVLQCTNGSTICLLCYCLYIVLFYLHDFLLFNGCISATPTVGAINVKGFQFCIFALQLAGFEPTHINIKKISKYGKWS
jgi:hypothetical protein